jgi:hypothetical protein
VNKVIKDLMTKHGVYSLGQPYKPSDSAKQATDQPKHRRFIKPAIMHDEDEEFLKNNRVRVT